MGQWRVAAVVHVITQSGSESPTVGGYAEGGSFNTMNAGLHGGAGYLGVRLNFGR